MLHALSEVTQFESDISHLLHILDYECGLGCDPSIQVPPKLAEAYRRAVARSRGIPAIRALTEWAIGILGSRLPDESCVQMYMAYKQLQDGSEDGAYNALAAATRATVLETPYADLTLAQAAATACLVSTLMDIADRMVAGMTPDLSIRPNIIKATDELWVLASGDGDIEALANTLSRFYYLYGYRLGDPTNTTVESIRVLMAPDHQNGDLPGFVVALWAAARDHLRPLNDAIVSKLAVLNAEYEMKRPFIEAELGLH